MYQANIASDKIELLPQSLYMLKENGDLDQALVNFHALPELDQAWAKAKEYFNNEYSVHRKHKNMEASQAGYGISSNATEQQ